MNLHVGGPKLYSNPVSLTSALFEAQRLCGGHVAFEIAIDNNAANQQSTKLTCLIVAAATGNPQPIVNAMTHRLLGSSANHRSRRLL